MITRPVDESPELREQLYLSTPNSGLPSICLKLIGFTEYPISQLLPGYAMLMNSPAIPVVYRNSPHVSSRLAVTLSVPLGSRLKEQPPCGTCSSPGVGGGKRALAPPCGSHTSAQKWHIRLGLHPIGQSRSGAWWSMGWGRIILLPEDSISASPCMGVICPGCVDKVPSGSPARAVTCLSFSLCLEALNMFIGVFAVTMSNNNFFFFKGKLHAA